MEEMTHKLELEEWCLEKGRGLPEFTVMNKGNEDSPRFNASVRFKYFEYTTGDCFRSIDRAIDQTARNVLVDCVPWFPDLKPEQKVKETHKIASTTTSVPAITVGQDPSVGKLKVEETPKIAKIKTGTSDATVVCSNAKSKSETEGPTSDKTPQISEIQSYAVNRKGGTKEVQHQYKMKLQLYAERNSLGPPSYTTTTEGPPHALRFKSTVAIDGRSFESQGFYKTLKEAEHAAAQVALFSSSLNAFQQDDHPFYKNLLQELAQNEGFILPAYKTTKTGEAHKPIFFSTVEIEGEKFQGKTAKSKKQAEINAAKAAYIALTKRMSSRVGDSTSPVSVVEDESINTYPSSNSLTAVDPRGSHASASPLVSAPPTESMGKAEDLKHEHQGVDSTEEVNPNLISQEFAVTPKDGQFSSVKMTPPDLSGLSITDRPTLKKEGISSYLLCNKVRVYTKRPDMKFPKGTVLLPLGEDKWVPVSLEFPNEIKA